MIKAVIFDYGGVITSGGGGQGLSASLSKEIGITHEQANRVLGKSWHKLVRGEIDDDQFWQEVEQTYEESIPLEKRNIFVGWNEMQPRPEMLNFLAELKSKGLVVGLLSNAARVTSESIQAHGGYALFDPCILSYQVGYAKPDVEIYKMLLDLLPSIKPEEVLFVDDQERCMPPARALGLKTITATDSKEIIEQVRKTLAS